MRKAMKVEACLQEERAANYAEHFKNRALFKELPPDQQRKYQDAASNIPTPTLDKYGHDTYSTQDWMEIMEEAIHHKIITPRLINPWYTSDEGWEILQNLWKNLPEACG